jgi:integral membrane sensor domain MASE1
MTNYNLTNLTASSDLSGVIHFANDAVNQMLIAGALIAVFFIILVNLKRYELSSALLVSSWVTFILGLMLSWGGWLNVLWPLAYLTIASLTTLYVFTRGEV